MRPYDALRPHAVLLTGATGSLGSRICAHLLTATAATVHCLVRAADAASASARLTERLRAAGLTEETYRDRVVAVPGDLADHRLGLGARSYDALAETTGLIVHCGATVNLAADYEQLAPVNLGGTRAVVAFAERHALLTGRPAHLNHVSTLGSLLGARAAGLPAVDERTRASPQTAGPLGYPRSKAAAEGEVRAAADRGVRVTVFRPGVVTADGGATAGFESDLLVPLLRAAVALGAVPRTDAALPVATADTVAGAVVRLAGLPQESGDRTFHLVGPRPLELADLFAAVRRAGFPLEPVPVDLWWQRLDDSDHPAVREMLALSGVYRYTLAPDPAQRAPEVHSARTWEALEAAGVRAPDLDAAFLDGLVGSLIAQRTLPSPVRTHRA
ncbi:thioester reductase domain-containing protein [Kitasatospora viridis]|uniref:Thioester reductase-like protein n=1 Tax=Kitasatospora viridis TaxID=281105 RepID=A0A561TSD2_9ACTN|nr:thioester reductase domain-containing protein [Kitasatospora viridis]TWF90019.1 thioester reductase-like protein [Kitasatospora viridis]